MSINGPQSVLAADSLQFEIRREYRASKRHYFQENLRNSWEREPTLLENEPVGTSSKAWRDICNKTTTLYWAYDAQQEVSNSIRTCGGLIPVAGAICKSWLKHHYASPNMDFGRYLAKSLKVGQYGPSSVEDILSAHHIICKTVTETQKAHMNQEGLAESEQFSAKNYNVFPLCRAILVILDTRTAIEDLTIILGKNNTKTYSLDELAVKQSLLLVRTGDEADITHPIDFASLRHETLPLARPDLDPHIDAVRVSVDAAVSFLVGLQKREEAARPELYDNCVIDKWINPMLFLKAKDGGRCRQYWFPESEDELVEEVYKLETYDLRPQPWAQSATERVRKREAGAMDWNDLKEMQQWTRKWI